MKLVQVTLGRYSVTRSNFLARSCFRGLGLFIVSSDSSRFIILALVLSSVIAFIFAECKILLYSRKFPVYNQTIAKRSIPFPGKCWNFQADTEIHLITYFKLICWKRYLQIGQCRPKIRLYILCRLILIYTVRKMLVILS